VKQKPKAKNKAKQKTWKGEGGGKSNLARMPHFAPARNSVSSVFTKCHFLEKGSIFGSGECSILF